MRVIYTSAKTGAGIARAYVKRYGLPQSSEWSAGGSDPKRELLAIPSQGAYRLTAVSLFNGRPAGRIYGPRFQIKERKSVSSAATAAPGAAGYPGPAPGTPPATQACVAPTGSPCGRVP